MQVLTPNKLKVIKILSLLFVLARSGLEECVLMNQEVNIHLAHINSLTCTNCRPAVHSLVQRDPAKQSVEPDNKTKDQI